MTARGPYAKSAARRQHILDAALRIIGSRGMSAATVSLIAHEVGMSPNGLLHHFESKDHLLIEVLRQRDFLDNARFDSATQKLDRSALDGDENAFPDLLVELVRHNAEVSGLVRLFTMLGAEGTDPAHAAHEFFRDRYAGFRSSTATTIARLQQKSEVRNDLDAAHIATLLFAIIDGLQIQWLYEPTVPMPDVLTTFIDMLRPERAAT